MNSIPHAARLLQKAEYIAAFTGAGISVESGIPPFRGPEGLWSRYNPEVLDINYFYNNPEKSWKVIKKIFYDFFGRAKPNAAHHVLAEWEKAGLLKAVITQNIDNLHYVAGSRNIVEYHGTSRELTCIKCGRKYKPDSRLLENLPPRCECGGLLKPDFVFFGEGIPQEAVLKSANIVEKCDLMILIGTTGEIYPASLIPREASARGASIIEINTEASNYTDSITDNFIKMKASEALTLINEELGR